MQDASAEFEDAVAKPGRTWVPPRLRTDWDGSGYGGDGTIDDLSPQRGDDWQVEHDLDDGYPATVTFVSGVGVPGLSTQLGGRTVSGTRYSAVAYWSPLRTDSPIGGFDRDVAPVTFDIGLVTSAGPEYVRLFTGRMVNTPVRGGQVDLQTVSGARQKLAKFVQPPAVSAYRQGLTATWPISWTLHQCELYPSPPAREGCRWHVPMHGSARWFIPEGNYAGDQGVIPAWQTLWVYADGSGEFVDAGPDWVSGPFLTAPDLQLKTALSKRIYTSNIALGPGTDFMSQDGAAARLEFWVRGDATDVATAPGGSGSVSRLAGFQAVSSSALAQSIHMGINTSRQVFVSYFDGVNTRTLTSSDTLPTDGQWYMVGAAYDATTDRLWVRNFAGTTQSSTQTMTSTGFGFFLPDDFAATYPNFVTYLPIAEVQFTTGAQANVDNYPDWLADVDWTQGVRMLPSTLELNAVVETQPREAWELIGAYAQGELASVRPDENDVLEYLPLGWWVRDEQQTVVDTLSTVDNAGPLDIDQDPSKIRNAVRVTYTELEVEQGYGPVYQVTNQQEIAIPPGSTTMRFALSSPSTLVINEAYTFVDTDITGLGEGVDVYGYATFNTTTDGSGAYGTSETLYWNIDEWDPGSVTVTFTNDTIATTYYLANNVNKPALNIIGQGTRSASSYAYDADADSIATRGERALPVTAGAVQTSTAARRLARNLKMNLRRPVATIGSDSTGLTVAGNPLRQPGDLVTVADEETGASGSLWRVKTVRHQGKGAEYRNEVVVRQVLPIMIIGEGRVGETLIGPRE